MPRKITVTQQQLDVATPTQRRYLEAVIEHGGVRAAARALGVDHTNVLKAAAATARKAAMRGIAPEHGLTHGVPEPFVLGRGYSQLVDGDGKVRLTWLKATPDAAKLEEAMRAAVEALQAEVPRMPPAGAPLSTQIALCTVYTFTDSHVGMYAWPQETGEPWDLAEAERVLCGAMLKMVEASPPSETAVVVNLGDFLHFDSLVAETPTHRHPLDAAGRFGEIVGMAVKVLRYLVAAALQKHTRVLFVIGEGNHDLVSSLWLGHLFKALFENEPRVRVISGERPYYIHVHGETMLGWHHGHLKRMADLPLTFAAMFPREWGATTKRYIHTGHRHHVDEKEHAGVIVIQHPTLAANDAHSARAGYVSGRKATAITYHSRHGEVARATVTPEMLDAGLEDDERRAQQHKR